ncbi:DUF1877 family protein [Demequina iriomotensis]|uniref:DUF1877 family protein n=1 Tax=Demequina iriomotensis TaxID=1536641 RepID=UPI000783ACE9|nr:DUF1877 family protein [Demequina iriomotensis]
MGIRYYAYSFPAELTEAALADPRTFIGAGPCTTASSTAPEAPCTCGNAVRDLSREDTLDLDKAWSDLQRLTRPDPWGEAPRPAFRMFEGHITMADHGWLPWVRALGPEEVGEIAADLAEFQRQEKSEVTDDYVRGYLDDAVTFTGYAASRGRGFVYLIG